MRSKSRCSAVRKTVSQSHFIVYDAKLADLCRPVNYDTYSTM